MAKPVVWPAGDLTIFADLGIKGLSGEALCSTLKQDEAKATDRMLRAIDRPTIDHRGPEFQALGKEVLEGIKRIFQTRHPVIIYPASGTGAWEAALVNTLSAGDTVLVLRAGKFSERWEEICRAAASVGIGVERTGDVDARTVLGDDVDDPAAGKRQPFGAESYRIDSGGMVKRH